MARDRDKKISKQLSWLLRHAGPAEGLTMDEAGWVPIAEVLRHARVSLDDLVRVVDENDKGRLEIRAEKIRACQGHSTEGMPVTHDALEASWQPYEGEGPLWHGTHVGAVASIAREGISPVARTHVHLAEELDSKVGKRAHVDVMLEVSVRALRETGLRPFRSPNGVILVRRVPPSCLVGLEAITSAARARKRELLEQLGR